MLAFNSPKARKEFWDKLNKDHSTKDILKALDSVEAIDAGVLRRHYIDNIPLPDIALELGRSASTTRWYHHRGMYRLVAILYPELDSPFDLIHKNLKKAPHKSAKPGNYK